MKIGFVAYHGSLHTRRWVGFFAGRGHDVHVVTCGDEDSRGGAPYAVHDLGRPRPAKAGYFLRLPRARSTIRALAPDIVHAHFATSYGMLALASGVRPLVVTAHGDDILIAPKHPVLRPIVQRVLNAASLVTVPSEQMRDAAALLAPRVDIEVFQYGVETARLAAVAAATPRPAGTRPIQIVSARPMLALYRHEVLIDALARLGMHSFEWRCSLYGDGPSRPALEARTRRLGLEEYVTFHGRRPPEEIERALAAADLYVSVAESDGASLALLEALSLGPVPVLSDIPANGAWIRDGDNGILTRIEPEALAGGLCRALLLDRESVATTNFALASARADRDRNLMLFEARLEDMAASSRYRRAKRSAGRA